MLQYTWAQFRTYLRLARKRQAEERALNFLAINHAMGGGKGAKEFLQAMQADIAAADADE